MIEKVKPEYSNLTLASLGRRPTNIYDVRGLLTLLDRSNGDFLEIGGWYGSTLYELASRFPGKCFHSIDFLEITHKYECANTTRASRSDLWKYTKDLKNVKTYYMHSKTFNYSKKDIGMIFVDGDHSYEGCKSDTEKALKYLKKREKGGIIAWHDSLNSYFGVKRYLEEEIDNCYERKIFEGSQTSWIEL